MFGDLLGGIVRLASIPVVIAGELAKVVTSPVPLVGDLAEAVVNPVEDIFENVAEVLDD